MMRERFSRSSGTSCDRRSLFDLSLINLNLILKFRLDFFARKEKCMYEANVAGLDFLRGP